MSCRTGSILRPRPLEPSPAAGVLSTLRAMQPRFVRALAGLAAACGILVPASAQHLRPAGYFVQGGLAEGRVWSATAGLTWPWAWKTRVLGSELGGLTEAFVSHWDAPSSSDRRGFTQVGVLPLLRLRLDQGRSPWFAEAGIGLSVMDQHFVTPAKQLSTSFNFVDVVGIGRSFGTAGERELGLRLQHVSNAGIRAPNPGQDFVLLRYAAKF